MQNHPHRPFRGSSPPAGVTEWHVRSRRFRRLFRDVYVSRQAIVDELVLAEAALLLAPAGSVASHHTAARIWGAVVPEESVTHVTCAGPRPRVTGIAAHSARRGQLGTVFRGVRVTTPTQTFLDLSLCLDLVDLVVLGDSLVKARRVTPDELVSAADGASGKGCRRARRAARLVRCDVDSPMETRLRLLMILAGLPEPVVNHTIRDHRGRALYRFDLSYPDHRLVIEYDGRQHAESGQQWRRDLGRREWLDTNGWRIVVNTSKDLFRTPAHTLRRITGAMRDQGMPVPRLRDDWRRHFPSRADDIAHPA